LRRALQDLLQALMQRCLLHLPQIKLLASRRGASLSQLSTPSPLLLLQETAGAISCLPKKNDEKEKTLMGLWITTVHYSFRVTFFPWLSPFFILL